MSSINLVYQKYSDARFPPPADKELIDLENRLDIKLPHDYRQFILDYNGGYFTDPDLLLPDESLIIDGLTFLCGINATHPSAELASPTGLSPALFANNDPIRVLPIGYTQMGNLLYLSLYSEQHGHIGAKLARKQKYIALARTMNEFFELVK